MAKRRTQKRTAKRPPRSAGGGGTTWLAALLLLAAGGAGAWYLLRGDGVSSPGKASARPVRAASGATVRAQAAAVPTAKITTPPAVKSVAPAPAAKVTFAVPEVDPRVPGSWFEAQVALGRAGFSCGSIDGVGGGQTVAAWRAFQTRAGLRETSWLDPRTCAELTLETPATARYTVTAADLARLQPVSTTWLGKSQQSALDFETLLELVAETTRAHPTLLKKLNPDFDWERPKAGAELTVPAAARVVTLPKAAALHIQLEAHTLQAYDAEGRLMAHFPVSIARKVEKRPVGGLHVTVVIRDPNYTFDPEVFPESAEGQELGRRLVVPPGPNNPVGVAWIGLDRSGYGIHGTPNPEQVGRTESHGCFRLANWDARTLLEIAWVGLPVYVDP